MHRGAAPLAVGTRSSDSSATAALGFSIVRAAHAVVPAGVDPKSSHGTSANCFRTRDAVAGPRGGCGARLRAAHEKNSQARRWGVPAGDGSPFFGGGDIVVKPPFTAFSLFITHLCFAAQRERGYVQRLHFASNVQMVSQPQSNQDQADSTELPRGILQLYTGSVTPAYLKI